MSDSTRPSLGMIPCANSSSRSLIRGSSGGSRRACSWDTKKLASLPPQRATLGSSRSTDKHWTSQSTDRRRTYVAHVVGRCGGCNAGSRGRRMWRCQTNYGRTEEEQSGRDLAGRRGRVGQSREFSPPLRGVTSPTPSSHGNARAWILGERHGYGGKVAAMKIMAIDQP